MPQLLRAGYAAHVRWHPIRNERAFGSTVRVGEQRHLVTTTEEAPDEKIQDALDAAVVARWDRDVRIHGNRNSHLLFTGAGSSRGRARLVMWRQRSATGRPRR